MGTDRLLLRTLRSDERAAVLELLDEWPLGGPLRGRDFFRRYVEHDPTYRDENFLVAERDGRLVACVQVFPRLLRLRGAAVPTGGIGSVFTSASARGSGVSSALLAAAVESMRARGMLLSLLFASRHAFYARLGWVLWPRSRELWLRGDAPASGRAEPFDAARDLDAVVALHERTSAALDGTVLRDSSYWRSQPDFAGNPREDFVVARDATGRIHAYARGCLLEGAYMVTEIGRSDAPTAVDALADLVVALMEPREPDPVAADAGRASGDCRRMLVAPAHDDPPLAAALDARGIARRRFEERATMLRILDTEGLAGCTRVSRVDDETDAAYLARLIPPERFFYWPSDRF